MKHIYSITKYNPVFRDSSGRYLNDEWTAISDINKTFNGEILTMDYYKYVEDNYVKTVQLIMNFLNVPYLSINKLMKSFNDDYFESVSEQYYPLYSKNTIKDTYYSLKNDLKLSPKMIDPVIRLLLREDIGADVYFENVMKVFIGYDYLMGIHTSISIGPIITDIEQIGMFVEEV